VIAYSITDLDSIEKFEKVKQQLILIIEFKKKNLFKIIALRKLKKARKLVYQERSKND